MDTMHWTVYIINMKKPCLVAISCIHLMPGGNRSAPVGPTPFLCSLLFISHCALEALWLLLCAFAIFDSVDWPMSTLPAVCRLIAQCPWMLARP